MSLDAILPHEGNVRMNEETVLSTATLSFDVATTDFVLSKICKTAIPGNELYLA